MKLNVFKARETATHYPMAPNKYLTKEYLEDKTNDELLAFVYPNDREKLKQIMEGKS